MSLYDYLKSQEIDAMNVPFYAIVMAAMRRADTANRAKLHHEWPDVWEELQQRYYAPGGVLPGEE